MRCFSSCSGFKKVIKKTHLQVQDQCLSPRDEINEAVRVLAAAATKSRKQDEIINCIQFISKSNEEQQNSIKRNKNTPNDSNNLVENENTKAEQKSKKPKDERSDSIDTKSESTNLDNNRAIMEECNVLVQPESSESLFSLSIDSRKPISGLEIGGDNEVSSTLKENISTVNKSPSKISKYDEDKENEEKSVTTMKLIEHHDIAVDTSLSSWLVVSEKSEESQKSYKGRRILGEIGSNELKELNESLSPLSSSSCSVDAGVGTVGSYWRHTGMARDSRVQRGVE